MLCTNMVRHEFIAANWCEKMKRSVSVRSLKTYQLERITNFTQHKTRFRKVDSRHGIE